MGERGSDRGWLGAGQATPTIDDADAADPAAAQRYADWAERLRAKRRRDQAHILGDDLDGTQQPGYWAADDVITDSRRTAVVAGSPDRIECLGVLGLDPGASSDDVATAYRRLAKTHHPDRWAAADPAVQQDHAEQMMRVNAAYHALRL